MKNFYLTSFAVLIASVISAQEIDDMYFTGDDRARYKKLSQKVSPAEIILSKYREGKTSINSTDRIDNLILDKYKSNNKSFVNLSNKKKDDHSLKFNRENLYSSNQINKTFQDYQTLDNILPYYYRYNDPFNMIDPYTMMYYEMTSLDFMMLPRNIVGLRSLASFNPMLFFSNPYLSSIDPRLSPALLNLHYPSIAGYGFGCTINKHGTWMFINNGTGGGLGHTLSNRHLYVSGILSAKRKGARGGRSGRASAMNGENVTNSDIVYRRQSGITNSNISRDQNDGRGLRGKTFSNSQNELFRGTPTSSRSGISRSNRSSMLNNQNRRSLSNSRLSIEKINNITNYRNSIRSSTYSGMDDRGTSNYRTLSDNGRRSGYTAPNNSYYNSNSVRSSSSSRISGGYFSGSSTSGSSYSGGSGSSYSGGSSGSRGGGVVSGGSSGGSSRGGGRN